MLCNSVICTFLYKRHLKVRLKLMKLIFRMGQNWCQVIYRHNIIIKLKAPGPRLN